jgi:hypothetical protein
VRVRRIGQGQLLQLLVQRLDGALLAGMRWLRRRVSGDKAEVRGRLRVRVRVPVRRHARIWRGGGGGGGVHLLDEVRQRRRAARRVVRGGGLWREVRRKVPVRVRVGGLLGVGAVGGVGGGGRGWRACARRNERWRAAARRTVHRGARRCARRRHRRHGSSRELLTGQFTAGV